MSAHCAISHIKLRNLTGGGLVKYVEVMSDCQVEHPP